MSFCQENQVCASVCFMDRSQHLIVFQVSCAGTVWFVNPVWINVFFYYDILLYVTVFGRKDFRSFLGYCISNQVQVCQMHNNIVCTNVFLLFVYIRRCNLCLFIKTYFFDSLCEERTEIQCTVHCSRQNLPIHNIMNFKFKSVPSHQIYLMTSFREKICNCMYNHSASWTVRTPAELLMNLMGEKAERIQILRESEGASVLPNNPSQQLNRREHSHSLCLVSLAPSVIVLHDSGFVDLQENDRDVQNERLAGKLEWLEKCWEKRKTKVREQTGNTASSFWRMETTALPRF